MASPLILAHAAAAVESSALLPRDLSNRCSVMPPGSLEINIISVSRYLHRSVLLYHSPSNGSQTSVSPSFPGAYRMQIPRPSPRDLDCVNSIFTKQSKGFKWFMDYTWRNTGIQNTVPTPGQGNAASPLRLTSLDAPGGWDYLQFLAQLCVSLTFVSLYLLTFHLTPPFSSFHQSDSLSKPA